MEHSYIFQRVEYKYLLSPEQYHKFFSKISSYLEPDSHGRSTISNLYFDTDNFLLIRNSIDADNYKEKYRLRCYGVPTDSSSYFLEIKKKLNGWVYKRRIVLTRQQKDDFLSKKKLADSQIASEIMYGSNLYDFSPKALISYDRTAFYDKSNSDLRITFDENIRYRLDQPEFEQCDHMTPLLENGLVLMEIKSSDPFPLWLSNALSKEGIYRTSFSKYGLAYKNTLKK